MTERERFIAALERKPIKGLVPTFELVFFLTMEVLGKVHPNHRNYSQWNQMTLTEKKLHINDMADCHIDIAEKYGHSAIMVHSNPGDFETCSEILRNIREKTGDKYFLMVDRDPTYPMPSGDNMMEFTVKLYEESDKIKDELKSRVEECLKWASDMKAKGNLLDGFSMCCDYCFNTNPFYTPDMFDEFVTPFLKPAIDGYREMGYYSIKHTDGNIMPIIDQLVACGPDALHSLDPQGGVDLKEVKRLYGDKVCLIGNVNCGLLQTGTEEECIADIRRALHDGMEGGTGYVFATSNCVYTGLPLERYELMNKIWREEGIYK